MDVNGKEISSSVVPVKKIVLALPFRLPTWNALLAMSPWQRKKVRDAIHHAVSECIASENISQIPTERVLKLSWTGLQKQEYLQTITPASSKKYRTRKKEERKTKRLLKLSLSK